MSELNPSMPYLETDCGPSQRNATHLPTSVRERYAAVEELDKTIERPLEQRAIHIRAIEEHSAHLAPIRNVHADILCSIFLSCLPPPSTARSRMSSGHPAVVISHVCRDWRNRFSGANLILFLLPAPFRSLQGNSQVSRLRRSRCTKKTLRGTTSR